MSSEQMPTATAAIAAPPRRAKPAGKRAAFIIVNALIISLVGFSAVTHSGTSPGTALFVIALSLLCTVPLLMNPRGKQSLMLVFLAYCLLAFGAQDLVAIVSGQPVFSPGTGGLLSAGEIAILIGVGSFILGYTAVTRLYSDRNAGVLTREWSPRATLGIGVALWIVGFCIVANWQFGVGAGFAGNATPSAFLGFVSLLRLFHMLGALIVIYLFLTSRSKIALMTMLGMMAADAVLGFIGGAKEIALRAPILYLFSTLLLRERLPLVQGIIFILAAGILFSLFSAYRDEVHTRGESLEKALQNLDSRLDSITGRDVSSGERLSGGLDYFVIRISMKPLVEMTVARTGNDVEFQNGRTIAPLLYAFIPRLILPDKADNAMTGRLFNREFGVSEAPETYIACSQLAELYWNFGWPGVVIGMFIIGAVLGATACVLRLDINPTLPRFLLLLLTAYLLALRFEASIALSYTVWARAVVMFLLLHALMPKARRRPSLNRP